MTCMPAMSSSSCTTISQCFDNSPSYEEIIGRSGVVDYLRQFAQPFSIPSAVLDFVKRYMQELLLTIRRVYPSSAELASSGDGNGSSDSPADDKTTCTEPNANRSQVVASPMPGGDTACAASHEAVVTGQSMTAEDTPGGRSAAGHVAPDDTALHRANATELLALYLTAAHGDPAAVIASVVPPSLLALAQPTPPSPAVALCAQRLLLAAFDADFALTTRAIAAALDETVVQHTVRNLAASSVVAETVIALFGSALSAVTMMEPATQTQIFTQTWIEMHFPEHLVAYLDTVIIDTELYNYFYFMRQLLRRGFGHSAGPVVDELLRRSLVVPLIEKTLALCEADAAATATADSSGAPGPDEVPYVRPALSLAGEAMAVVVAIVAFVRRSLPLPETSAMYTATVDLLAPIVAVRERVGRFMSLLHTSTHDDGASHAGVPAARLGTMRLSVCELFVELLQFQLASTDELVVASGFLPALFTLCRRHPHNNCLARQLQLVVAEVCARHAFADESLAAAVRRDVLVRYALPPLLACCPPDIPAVDAANDNDAAHLYIVPELVSFVHEPALRLTALAAFVVELLHEMHEARSQLDGNMNSGKGDECGGDGVDEALLVAPSSRPQRVVADRVGEGRIVRPERRFVDVVQLPGLADAAAMVQERVDAMRLPVTGLHFTDKGSARTPAVTHRTLVNYAGDRYAPGSGAMASSPLNESMTSTWLSTLFDVSRADTSHSPASDIVVAATHDNAERVDEDGGGGLTRPMASSLPLQQRVSSPAQTTLGVAGEEVSLPLHIACGSPDEAAFDMERVAQECRQLREAGSPQLRAYPSFRTMQLTFTRQRDTEDNTSAEAVANAGQGDVTRDAAGSDDAVEEGEENEEAVVVEEDSDEEEAVVEEDGLVMAAQMRDTLTASKGSQSRRVFGAAAAGALITLQDDGMANEVNTSVVAAAVLDTAAADYAIA